jgi:uncharacterized protein YjiS (DUF1127 family)
MYIPKMKQKTGKPPLPDQALRNLVTRIIKDSGISRREIAEELSRGVGRLISKRMLDEWTAGSNDSKVRSRFPASYVQAFCEVTNDTRLQRHLLGERLRELLSLGESAEKVILLNGTVRPKR